MQQLLDLDEFVKAMTDKGYVGYFHTESCCAGRLKDSISEFLELWREGIDVPLVENYLHLSKYLEWKGEDEPSIECNIRVRYENRKFDLQQTEMCISRIDRFRQPMKEVKLTGLDPSTIPTVREAIAMVSGTPKQEVSSSSRRFKL